MLDIEDFDAVFPPNVGYSHALVDQIKRNRKAIGGRTFFERLLELLHIKGKGIYPPTSPTVLKQLHTRILSAPISLHYKHCLFFYLLKDLSSPSSALDSEFGKSVHLEKRFWTFVEGLWLLDNLRYEDAVNNLTHPSIIPTFPDEIMGVLLHYASEPSQNAGRDGDIGGDQRDILPLAYFNVANPPLVDNEVRMEFAKYMADRNVTETLYWIRARPEHEQKGLLETLVKETLDRNSFSTNRNETYTREDKALEFVSLPLTPEEEKIVELYLTEGKGRTLRGAWDTVEMRRIATGRLREAAGDTGSRGKRVDMLDWEVLREGVRSGLGPRGEEMSFNV